MGIRITCCIYLAAEAGELKLASADPNVQPILDYNYLDDPFDRDRFWEIVRLCLKLGEYQNFEDIIEERVDPTDADLAYDKTLDEWIMRGVTTSQDKSYTCKTGPSLDPMAVVDQYGNGHGLEGLRVANASIMAD